MLPRVSPLAESARFPSLGFPVPLRARRPPVPPCLPREPKLPTTSATPGKRGRGSGAAGELWVCNTFLPASWDCCPSCASSLLHYPSARKVVALPADEAAAARSARNRSAC